MYVIKDVHFLPLPSMTGVLKAGTLVPSPFPFSALFLAGIWCRIFQEQSENAAPHFPPLVLRR